MFWSIANRLLWCEPTLQIQLLETLLIAACFAVSFPPAASACGRFFRSKPWYGYCFDLMKDITEKMLGITASDQMVEKIMGQMIPILCQHFTGGFLCAPAVFGLGVRRDVAYALARHGALCELGWEIQDTVERLWERHTHPEGKKLQPSAMFKVLFYHHAMQWALVIPMNLYYSQLSGYHELIFMLEGAAGLAGVAMFYGYTCDTSKRSELRQLVICNALNLMVMVYARFIHYWWSVYKCLSFFYADAALVELALGSITGLFLMPYVAVIFIPDQWRKLCKFTALYLEQQKPVPERLPVLLSASSGAVNKSMKQHVE